MTFYLTLKSLCEWSLIIWAIFIVIDTTQTFYALVIIGGERYVEMNPLGFPLAAIFIVAIWLSEVASVEILIPRLVKSKQLRNYKEPLLALIFLAVWFTIGRVSLTVIHNFKELFTTAILI